MRSVCTSHAPSPAALACSAAVVRSLAGRGRGMKSDCTSITSLTCHLIKPKTIALLQLRKLTGVYTEPYSRKQQTTVMAVAPKFAGQKLHLGTATGSSATAVFRAVHTLEFYLDYVCPFSAKQFHTLYNTVVPMIRENPEWASQIDIVFRHQVQPWHPSSTLVHEAGVAVQRVAPDKFWAFSEALFKDQKAYFDVRVVNETRNQTYARLAKLAAESVGVNEKELYGLLAISDKPGEDGSLNSGNGVTNDLKLLIKAARLVGVHVSPTVLFDGLVAGDISSGWTKDQWAGWLKKSIV
ncbi:hypothetical protein MN608_10459 [Microdochium nivale]|nr:hypothetical protein MN608_10459 [Microdochium nivale]